jgi:hypothetical protein
MSKNNKKCNEITIIKIKLIRRTDYYETTHFINLRFYFQFAETCE